MNFARVVTMRPAEVADRLRQENLKVLERLHIVGSGELEPGALTLDHFRLVASERFFAGASCPELPQLIAARLPDARALVLKAADSSRAGSFDLLGYHALDFGDPIDWQLDPLSGVRAKLEHWTRIDPLDRAAVGDHKVVWELNRQQWLLHWAQAYAYTGEEAYAQGAVAMLEHWLRANPTGLGVNWASSLELAFRSISWCWVLVLLRDSPALHAETFARVLSSIHAHATHITRYLSTTYSPNTHLLGEALGLFYVGVLFPEIDSGASWRATGQRILVDEITRQVLPDGVCFEQSTCYQRYTAELSLHFLILAARNGVTVPSALYTPVRRCVDFLLALRRADGTVPQIGDGDGGWLLPLVPREAEDMRGVFGVAAAFFGGSDYAEAAGGAVIEAGWLCGPNALREVPTLSSGTQRLPSSQLFEHGGYAVLRSDPGSRAHKLVLDVGPLGCPASGGHGHADLLSLTCDIFGAPCIVDPGMPTYGGSAKWRDAFRSTALHSSVTVDGLSQAVPSGSFSWKSRPSARVRSWKSDADFDFVDGEHDAYSSRCDGLIHRRRVVFVKPSYWVVIDDLRDNGGGTTRCIDIGFQFAPRHRLTLEDPWVRVVSPEGHALFVRGTADRPLRPSIHEGELGEGPFRGWFSAAYGCAQAAPALSYRVATTLPFRAVTYLVPTERRDAPSPASLPPESTDSLLQRLSQ